MRSLVICTTLSIIMSSITATTSVSMTIIFSGSIRSIAIASHFLHVKIFRSFQVAP